MHNRIVILFAVILPVLLSASERSDSAPNEHPTLKLIKKDPDRPHKKIVIIKQNGERKVLVKVKKIKKPSQQPLPDNNVTDKGTMITDIYYMPEDDSNETKIPEETISDTPDENLSAIAEQPMEADHNATLVTVHFIDDNVSESTEEAETTAETLEPKYDTNLPASNWKRHYFTLAVGSLSRSRTTNVETVDLTAYITLENSDHTLYADGSEYEYDDHTSPLHVEAGYRFRPSILGTSLSLSGYYDEDLIEFRAALEYTFEDIAALYPMLRLGGAMTHDNADDSDYDATAYFGGISLEKRLFNGMIMGVEYLYLKRSWIKKEEFFGTVTCEDRESALRMTLDVPLF